MHVWQTGNLTRFRRHVPEDSLDASFAASFGFRQEGSAFSIFMETDGLPGPDDVFAHVQLDARPLFHKLLGMEVSFPTAPADRRLFPYRSSRHYRSHLHEYFHWTAEQHMPAPPLEGECRVFFAGCNDLVVHYRLHNPSTLDIPVQVIFRSEPCPGDETVCRIPRTGGFVIGAQQRVASPYQAWMHVSGEQSGNPVQFRRVEERLASVPVDIRLGAGETVEWLFRARFGTGKKAPSVVAETLSPARALQAAIRRCNRAFAALPPLEGEARRFEPLVLRAAGILQSNRFRDTDLGGKSVMTIQAGKSGVAATWWWDSATHMPGLGLCADRDTVRGAVHLLLDGVGEDGCPVVRYGHGTYRTGVQMPILAWGIQQAGASLPDPTLIRRAYPALCRYVRWWLGRKEQKTQLVTLPEGGTAQDDSPRWSSHLPIHGVSGTDWSCLDWGTARPSAFACPDVNAHVYLEAQVLAHMAGQLGLASEAQAWKREAQALGASINRWLFDPATGMYQDLHLQSGQFTGYLTAGCFMPIYAGLAARQQAIAACKRYLLDPGHFYTTLPFAGVDRSHPCFRSGGRLYDVSRYPGALLQSAYWLGRVWLHYSYWLTGALWQAGLHEQADAAADKVLDVLLPQESLYECYDPLTGVGNGHAEFSWGAAPVLALAYRLYRRGPLGIL